MPAISPTLYQKSFELTAEFYALGITCAPLVAFNEWMAKQQIAPTRQLAIATARPNAAMTPFETAVETALQSAPTTGIAIGDLQTILKDQGRTQMQIVGVLTKLQKRGLATQQNGLWVYTTGRIIGAGALDKKRKARSKRTARTGAAAERQAAVA